MIDKLKNSSLKITLTGDIGSGKSRVSAGLKKKLDLTVYSTGSIQREIAKKRGLTTLELNRFAEKNREIDDEIDNFTKELQKKKEGFIVDSRLAWFFIPKSFKVYLFLKTEIAAERIFQDRNRINEQYKTLRDTMNAITARRFSEVSRFKTLYGVDLNNEANYDLVINTQKATIAEVVDKIILTATFYFNQKSYEKRVFFNIK